jgi:peptidoglycan hydrolase-like protein with peptidoglycan-binding domain
MTLDPVQTPAAPPDQAAPATPPRRRRRWPIVVALVAVVAVVSLAATAVLGGWFDRTDATDSPTRATSLATVELRDVSSTQQVSGTLGYASDVDVVGHLTGIVTSSPSVGDVLSQGDVLYRVNDQPVVLLNGSTPAWRDFTWGETGSDVKQLNAALVALGYTDGLDLDPESDMVTWTTQQAVKQLQEALGVTETGTLTLGQVVFLPGPLRVTEVVAGTGSQAAPGQPVLTASSTTPQVSVQLKTGLREIVTVGDPVVVTLPDLTTTTGTVQSVGTVASKAEDGTATIPLTIALDDPQAAADLDQAPVSVSITTRTVEDALVVPVTALLATADGYAVEVDDGDGTTHLVTVELGLFDSGGGVVQVTGTGLEAGQRVVVPGT